MVRIVRTIVNGLCGHFAMVLVAQIGVVTGAAIPANRVASFELGLSSAVSLGFGDLFTPDNEKFQILLNNGFAIVWDGLRRGGHDVDSPLRTAQPSRTHALEVYRRGGCILRWSAYSSG